MEQIDSNQDGVIEHREALAFLDLNSDGVHDSSERNSGNWEDPIAAFAIPIISLLMRAKEIPHYSEDCNFSSFSFLMKKANL